MAQSDDKADDSSSAYDDYVWEVETSAPADSVESDDVEEIHPEQAAADKTITFIIAGLLASFVLPAIFGSIFLIAPLLVAIAGLAWAFKVRKKGIKTKVLQPVIWTSITMMILGYLALELVPDASWDGIFPILFKVGAAILGLSVLGIIIILAKDKGKRKH